MISEHTRKARLAIIGPMFLFCLMFLTGPVGVGDLVYLFGTGQKITGWDAAIVIIGGCLMSFLGGIFIARFIRRMLPVRKVLLYADDSIGVVSWRSKIFTAKLPDNIKHISVIGTDFSVTLQIGKRFFVVSSDEFSDKEGINQFWRRFVERCQNSNLMTGQT